MSKKPTQAEKRERVELCIRLIGNGLYDHQIKKAVAEKYGCTRRCVQNYIYEARHEIRGCLDRDKKDLQGEALAYYQQIMQDQKATNSDRLFARKRVDKLLGLEEPQRHEHTGEGGQPLKFVIEPASPPEQDPDSTEG